MTTVNKKIIFIVGHGSRVQEANQDFERFVDGFRSHCMNREIRYGYIELAKPDFKEALERAAAEADEITVLPLFLFSAGHVKNDLPLVVESIRQKYPRVIFRMALCLGAHPNMAALVNKRVQEAKMDRKIEKTVVLMVGRGSSDPDAKRDFSKLVRLCEETLPYGRAAYCFMAIVKPTVEEALERLAREGMKTIIVQPYLLFAGCLVAQLEEIVERFSKLYPGVTVRMTKSLGIDPLIFDLLKDRINGVE